MYTITSKYVKNTIYYETTTKQNTYIIKLNNYLNKTITIWRCQKELGHRKDGRSEEELHYPFQPSDQRSQMQSL